MVRNWGEVRDELVDSFYKISMNAKYGFAGLVGSWGVKIDRKNKRSLFKSRLEYFARDCGIMALDDDLYYYNGKIYEKLPLDVLYLAYVKWLGLIGIVEEYAENRGVFKDFFCGQIKVSSQLQVRNDLMAFSNKVVDFRFQTGPESYPFSRLRHVIEYHPYKYDPEARAPKFMSFLREVLPEKPQREILQMFLGLGLVQTSDAYDETLGKPRGAIEFCLLLVGTGANGKSVLFNVISALFGRHHITTLDYETMTADGDEGLRGRAALRGAVFNWSSDSNAQKFGVKNSDQFKRIVSGEPYNYRIIGHEVMEGKHCPYLIFNLNEFPKLYEQADGVVRRLQYVHFKTTIPRARQNPNLASEIIRDELPGVFNWVLRGAREIRRRKFRFPNTGDDERAKIQGYLSGETVMAWKMAYGVRSTPQVSGEISLPIKRTLMYGSYKLFCQDNGVSTPVTETQFSKAMIGLHFRRDRRADGMYYVCYGIREADFYKPVLVDTIQEDEANTYSDDPESLIKDD